MTRDEAAKIADAYRLAEICDCLLDDDPITKGLFSDPAPSGELAYEFIDELTDQITRLIDAEVFSSDSKKTVGTSLEMSGSICLVAKEAFKTLRGLVVQLQLESNQVIEKATFEPAAT